MIAVLLYGILGFGQEYQVERAMTAFTVIFWEVEIEKWLVSRRTREAGS